MWRLALTVLFCLTVAGCVETTGSVAQPHAGAGTCRQAGPGGKVGEDCNCPNLGLNGFCPTPGITGEASGY